jgi:hypothetical protein
MQAKNTMKTNNTHDSGGSSNIERMQRSSKGLAGPNLLDYITDRLSKIIIVIPPNFEMVLRVSA